MHISSKAKIILDVILEGNSYRLPNLDMERLHPILFILRKGIDHIFTPITNKFPEHEIHVVWNEDTRKMRFSSKTASVDSIREMLTKVHSTIIE